MAINIREPDGGFPTLPETALPATIARLIGDDIPYDDHDNINLVRANCYAH